MPGPVGGDARGLPDDADPGGEPPRLLRVLVGLFGVFRRACGDQPAGDRVGEIAGQGAQFGRGGGIKLVRGDAVWNVQAGCSARLRASAAGRPGRAGRRRPVRTRPRPRPRAAPEAWSGAALTGRRRAARPAPRLTPPGPRATRTPWPARPPTGRPRPLASRPERRRGLIGPSAWPGRARLPAPGAEGPPGLRPRSGLADSRSAWPASAWPAPAVRACARPGPIAHGRRCLTDRAAGPGRAARHPRPGPARAPGTQPLAGHAARTGAPRPAQYPSDPHRQRRAGRDPPHAGRALDPGPSDRSLGPAPRGRLAPRPGSQPEPPSLDPVPPGPVPSDRRHRGRNRLQRPCHLLRPVLRRRAVGTPRPSACAEREHGLAA